MLEKGMERIVFKRVYNFLLEKELLYKYQSGFVPGHSTSLQLIDIYHLSSIWSKPVLLHGIPRYI